jgi:hypothetical protein
MKRVTNKELISVILINIGALAFAVYMCSYTTIDKRYSIVRNQYKIIRYWKFIAEAEKCHHPYS